MFVRYTYDDDVGARQATNSSKKNGQEVSAGGATTKNVAMPNTMCTGTMHTFFFASQDALRLYRCVDGQRSWLLHLCRFLLS